MRSPSPTQRPQLPSRNLGGQGVGHCRGSVNWIVGVAAVIYSSAVFAVSPVEFHSENPATSSSDSVGIVQADFPQGEVTQLDEHRVDGLIEFLAPVPADGQAMSYQETAEPRSSGQQGGVEWRWHHWVLISLQQVVFFVFGLWYGGGFPTKEERRERKERRARIARERREYNAKYGLSDDGLSIVDYDQYNKAHREALLAHRG